jgi:hypothetical protein
MARADASLLPPLLLLQCCCCCLQPGASPWQQLWVVFSEAFNDETSDCWELKRPSEQDCVGLIVLLAVWLQPCHHGKKSQQESTDI